MQKGSASMSGRFQKRTNTTVMMSFLLGLVFSAVYTLGYGLLTEFLYQHLSLPVPDLVNSILHAVLISALGTAVCCLGFLLPQKELVPAGYLWMTFFVTIAYLFTLVHFAGEERSSLLMALSLFCLAPVVVGNGVVWPVFHRLEQRGC